MRYGCVIPLLALLAAPVAAQQDTTRLPSGVELAARYQVSNRQMLAIRPLEAPLELAEVAGRVHDVLRQDLDYSDRFNVVPTPEELAAGEIDYKLWNGLGVVYVVVGQLMAAPEGGFQLTLTAHDVVYATVKKTATYRLPELDSPDFRMAVHAAADDLVLGITGQPGMAATRVAFARQNGGGSYDLLVVDADGENLRRLVGWPEALYSPTWSPDGKKLAYAVSGRGGWQLVERDLANGVARPIPLPSTSLVMTPAYSPNGQKLAFAMHSGSATEIYEYDVAQHCCLRRLTGGPRIDLSPTFSPDGSQMAFNSSRLGPTHIYVMPSGGGEAVRLSPYVYGEGGEYYAPDWSPIGSMVAFHGRSRGQFQIMVADASRPGAQIRQLTTEGRNEDPSFAPDGRHIVFTSSGVGGGGPGLYVIDMLTGRTRMLISGAHYRMADWSPTLLRASELLAGNRQ